MQLIECKTKLEKINRAKLLEELGTKDKKVFISLCKMNNKMLVQLGQIKVKFFFFKMNKFQNPHLDPLIAMRKI